MQQQENCLTLCSYHITYSLQRESTCYSCLNAKHLLAQNRHSIWSLSNYSGTWTHNHLLHKPTLNCLAKLVKWLSCVVSTYLYSAFDCLFSSCHILFSEWIHTLLLPEHKDLHTQNSCEAWLNGWVFIYEVSGYGFESHCSHFNKTVFIKNAYWNQF